jgi:hypothetical protein
VIRGQVIGRKSGNVYLYDAGSFRAGSQLVDSVKLTSQFFSFTKSSGEPKAYYLNVDGAVGQYYFIWDKDVVITLKPDDLNQSIIEDSPLNDQLKTFSDTVEVYYKQKLNEARKSVMAAKEAKDNAKVGQLYQEYVSLATKEWNWINKYIRTNNDSWASLFILLTHHRDFGRKNSLDLLNVLSPTIQASQLASRLKTTLNDSNYIIIP